MSSCTRGREFEALVRYMMRSPVSLRRLRFTAGSPEVVYARKAGHERAERIEGEKIDAEEFVARGYRPARARMWISTSAPPSKPADSCVVDGSVPRSATV